MIKKNQKINQQKGFFAALGLCPAKRAKPRAGIFCPASLAHSYGFSKISYALASAQGHHCFTRFRPKLLC
ncbi:hypothetical protein FFF34_015515 [Inquilinus sp. KBS0705]|nr:hypothetical protein FFF34_015515 [Inquilinus sp. KBS0705]